MLQAIIVAIIGAIFKLFGMEREKKVKSENEALKGRVDSVEDSYSEQDRAREAAEKARKETEEQGDGKDIFGADEWNGKNDKPQD
ncbi:MAG: hypothetical protein ACTSRA_21630 [Promethearchaeota archaeon]